MKHYSTTFLAALIIGIIITLGALPQVLKSDPLEGEYYIPQGIAEKGFETFAEALEALQSKGVAGPVMLIIDDDLDETGMELELIGVNFTETNYLVIKPASGKSPTITLDNPFYMEHVSYITIDGSNSGSNDQNLRIHFVGTSFMPIWVAGNSRHINIQNIIITHPHEDLAGTNIAGIRIRRDDAATTVPENVLIRNCVIGSEEYPFKDAVQLWGTGTPLLRVHAEVIDNIIYASHRGITTFYNQDNVYTGNKIIITGHYYRQAWYAGIYLAGGLNFVINNNEILILGINTDESRYVAGININLNNGVIDIYNNMISIPSYFNNTGDADNNRIYGIATHREGYSETYNIFFNTVYIGDTGETGRNAVKGFEDGLNLTIGVTKSISTFFNLLNNILVNKRDAENAYGFFWPFETEIESSNYNNIFVAGEDAHIGFYDETPQKTLLHWRLASGRDANSVSVEVEFVSETNLRLTGNSIGDNRLAGIPIDFILYDIDDNPRDFNYPYMGAYEAPVPLSVERIVERGIPAGFSLSQNYPNPFNPTTTVQFALPKEASVRLEIYNMLGQRVKVLIADEWYQPGVYTVTWDARDEFNNIVPSGSYIYRITAGEFTDSKQLMFVK